MGFSLILAAAKPSPSPAPFHLTPQRWPSHHQSCPFVGLLTQRGAMLGHNKHKAIMLIIWDHFCLFLIYFFKIFFTYFYRLPRQTVGSPSPEVLKAKLDGTLSSLIWWGTTCPWQEVATGWSLRSLQTQSVLSVQLYDTKSTGCEF